MSKYQITRLLVHLCLQALFFIGRMRLRRCDYKHGRIRWRRQWWHRQQRGVVIELCYMWCICVVKWWLCIVVKTIWIVVIKVVIRHFYRCCYRSSLLWFFCYRGFGLLVTSYGWTQWTQRFIWFGQPERNTLRPQKNWVVLLEHALPEPAFFVRPCDVMPARAFYISRSDNYIETRGPTGGPDVVETLYNI
jgi:hypothetical protein